MPDPTPSPALFVSGHAAARWIGYFMIVAIVVAVFAIVLNYLQIEQISKAMSRQPVDASVASFKDTLNRTLELILPTLLLCIGILFFWWFHRVHKNLPALGVENLHYTPTWAVAGFFVPLLNLVRPFHVAREVWNASNPDISDGTSWHSYSAPSIIKWWWASLLAWSSVSSIASQLGSSSPVILDELYESKWWCLASHVLSITAACLTIALVKSIDRRQETKHSRISSMTVDCASS